MRRAVTWFDGGDWHEGVVATCGAGVQLLPEVPTAGLRRLDGVVTGGFTDHHVHLQLVDASPLAGSVLGRVIDLGGDPEVLAATATASHNSGELTRTRGPAAKTSPLGEEAPELCGGIGVEIAFAGAFLTPPGGYPSDRAWAPAGSVREIETYQDAASAVAEMHQAGAAVIKVASNNTTGPVFSDEMFAAIVDLASSFGKSVIAHAEGPGEAQRACRLGARLLAHAPFTERLTDQELSRMNGSVAWVSSLAIHEGEAYDIAVDNVRRFRRLRGGTVLYGTDMGNGPTPVGLSTREIAALRGAGIDGADLLQSLVPVDPLPLASRLNFFPGASPHSADPLLARPLTAADLED